MNEILLTEDLRSLNNALGHSGVAGMRWHRHLFGKWQPHAVYAGGKPDPNANEKEKAKSKSSRADLKKYSDEDLRRMTERLNLENNYQYAVQNAIRNEMSYKRLQEEYRNSLKSPTKKRNRIAVLDKLSSKMADAFIDVGVDTGKKFMKAKTKQYIKDHNRDLYDQMFQQDEQGKKKKNNNN